MYNHMTLGALIVYKRHITEIIENERDKQSNFYFNLIEKRNNISKEINYRIKRGFEFHEK